LADLQRTVNAWATLRTNKTCVELDVKLYYTYTNVPGDNSRRDY